VKNIEYSETDEQGLDLICSLWQKLNEHHEQRSRHFAGHFAQMTFEKRKRGLLDKVVAGKLHINLAIDGHTGEIVGYCASTVSAGKQGEIESIYIEQDYRRAGIGSHLLQRALDWMDKQGVIHKMLIIGVGNEEVVDFYHHFNFEVRSIIMEQVDKG
jgi:ribosomal protein S18 acetylase RimI-like enzyme